ncbi:hypothetical protein, partial [Sphingomonas solaris]|uniref:hypothetical protein n=1 Tax=Alterirhizorhabdus solaris TaxID=2529389 RepID=UPI001939CD24
MESLPATPTPGLPGVRYRVAFLFNAQLHQLMHGLTTAIALAADPAFDVHVIGASRAHLDCAGAMIARAGGAPITLSRAGSDMLDAIARAARGAVPLKLARLAGQLRHLAGFDAIALPERTSILLRRLGVTGPRYIHLDHGAGDRAVGFDPRIKLFDFVLLPGHKTRGRMLREGYLRPGAHAVVGYPKYDAVDLMRDPAWSPFADARPVVLYNPHFSSLGSWHRMGRAVLEAFAAQDRYNLVFAPHVRLFDDPARRAAAEADLAVFAGHPRIHLDLGSDRSVDMSYPMLADVYLGDVSSQVYEFLRTPRPCVFLDGQARAWEADENYAHWRFGPVLDGVPDGAGGLIDAIDAARAGHEDYRAAQQAGFAETFDLTDEPSSVRAARAIATFLRFDAVASPAEGGATASNRRK